MRELIAGLVALLLLLAALALAGALHLYRKRRRLARDRASAAGYQVIAELPIGPDLTLFAEGDRDFLYGERLIPKNEIRAVYLLVNGAPMSAAGRTDSAAPGFSAGAEQFEDALRDRWDVVIQLPHEPIRISCGAIRERVSQELATSIFEAVRGSVDQDAGKPGSRKAGGKPGGRPTTPSPAGRRGD